MAGISSAPEEVALASWSIIADQMGVFLGRADDLLRKDPVILGLDSREPAIFEQLKALVQTAKKGRLVLSRAEEKEINVSGKLEKWLEEVNAAILTAEDVLDECRHRVLACKEPRDGNKLRTYFSTLGRPSLSNRLKSLNSKLTVAFKEAAEKLSLAEREGAPRGRSAAAQAATDCSKLESEVVEDGLQTVVDKLLNQDSTACLSVINLVKWADTGKRVLAQLAYKNFDVMYYFDERMWVQVGDDHLDIGKIAECMWANLGGGASEEEAVSVHLKKRLEGKRFLLVLVGASAISSARFTMLKQFLEELGGFRGSKVLITTGKNPNIQPSFVYDMKLDTGLYRWTLFEKIAFADGGPSRTAELLTYGTNIVKLCGGNTLYIKLVGSLLHRLKTESQWLSIHDKLVEMEGSSGIPQLCFDYMSSIQLKRCFLYCYNFPKGHLMRREDLIELWMALGYLDLPYRSPLAMEALGLGYYDVLMKSSFFQVSEDDDFDTQSCKIPDVLHGLNLFTEASVDRFKTIVKGDAKACPGAMHLTLINCDVIYSKTLKSRFSELQSLHLENTKGLADFLGCAKRLRVLIIVDALLEDLPDSIGKLICLRYLDISRTKIVKLPDSISELYNLQTLRLHDLQYIPNNFEKLLVSMMHLYIHELGDLYDMYELLSKCSKLVYLSSAKAMLKVFVEKEGKLDNMKELHKLSNRCSTISIHCLENASNDASGITAWLSKVPAGTESLKLNWSVRREGSIDEDVLDKLKPHQSLKHLLLENFKGTTFPSWMTEVDSYISNLVTLELENCSWCEKLPPLGRLSGLRSLKILGMDNLKSISDDFYGSGVVFPKLKEFSLRNLSELVAWSDLTPSSTTAFPYLERFEVDQCPKLESIPDVVLVGEQKCLRKFKVSLCKDLNQLPKGLGEAEYIEDLELFGLPLLNELSLGRSNNLKTLIIGCLSDEFEKNDLVNQLIELSSLATLTIWGYGQKNLPELFGQLSSLEVLKFESCRSLMNLPYVESLKELHIYYCPLLEANCIRGSRPDWPKVSHIKTIVVNNEKIRQPPIVQMP